jgi:hypothetical protein
MMSASATCGRRPGKKLSDGRVRSRVGLLMRQLRQLRPLALMLCADRVRLLALASAIVADIQDCPTLGPLYL